MMISLIETIKKIIKSIFLIVLIGLFFIRNTYAITGNLISTTYGWHELSRLHLFIDNVSPFTFNLTQRHYAGYSDNNTLPHLLRKTLKPNYAYLLYESKEPFATSGFITYQTTINGKPSAFTLHIWNGINPDLPNLILGYVLLLATITSVISGFALGHAAANAAASLQTELNTLVYEAVDGIIDEGNAIEQADALETEIQDKKVLRYVFPFGFGFFGAMTGLASYALFASVSEEPGARMSYYNIVAGPNSKITKIISDTPATDDDIIDNAYEVHLTLNKNVFGQGTGGITINGTSKYDAIATLSITPYQAHTLNAIPTMLYNATASYIGPARSLMPATKGKTMPDDALSHITFGIFAHQDNTLTIYHDKQWQKSSLKTTLTQKNVNMTSLVPIDQQLTQTIIGTNTGDIYQCNLAAPVASCTQLAASTQLGKTAIIHLYIGNHRIFVVNLQGAITAISLTDDTITTLMPPANTAAATNMKLGHYLLRLNKIQHTLSVLDINGSSLIYQPLLTNLALNLSVEANALVKLPDTLYYGLQDGSIHQLSENKNGQLVTTTLLPKGQGGLVWMLFADKHLFILTHQGGKSLLLDANGNPKVGAQWTNFPTLPIGATENGAIEWDSRDISDPTQAKPVLRGYTANGRYIATPTHDSGSPGQSMNSTIYTVPLVSLERGNTDGLKTIATRTYTSEQTAPIAPSLLCMQNNLNQAIRLQVAPWADYDTTIIRTGPLMLNNAIIPPHQNGCTLAFPEKFAATAPEDWVITALLAKGNSSPHYLHCQIKGGYVGGIHENAVWYGCEDSNERQDGFHLDHPPYWVDIQGNPITFNYMLSANAIS